MLNTEMVIERSKTQIAVIFNPETIKDSKKGLITVLYHLLRFNNRSKRPIMSLNRASYK